MGRDDALAGELADVVEVHAEQLGDLGGGHHRREAFELHAQGRTTVEFATRDLVSVNEDFEAVETGDVPARLVFDFER